MKVLDDIHLVRINSFIENCSCNSNINKKQRIIKCEILCTSLDDKYIDIYSKGLRRISNHVVT